MGIHNMYNNKDVNHMDANANNNNIIINNNNKNNNKNNINNNNKTNFHNKNAKKSTNNINNKNNNNNNNNYIYNNDHNNNNKKKKKNDNNNKDLHTLFVEYKELQRGDKIGQGAFGCVYKGHWHGVDVAIKELHCASVATPANVKEFEDEIAVMWCVL